MSRDVSTQSLSVANNYKHIIKRRLFWLAILLLATVLSFLVDLSLGYSRIGLSDFFLSLFNLKHFDAIDLAIIWDFRLPQAVIVLLVGAALGLAGAEMQTVLNNPLASPFTLGVSHAASFGASLAFVMNVSLLGLSAKWLVAGNAFIFALIATMLLDVLARWRQASTNIIVLFGIAIGFTFSALTSLLQYIADSDQLQSIVFWSMGSVTRIDWQDIAILAVALLLAFPFSMLSAWKLTALRLGEDRAASFGINIKRLRLASLFRISVLSGLAVAFVGTIGFVGLVGPHIARMLFGEDHRFYLPASAIASALILSVASIVSKNMIAGVIIPIGIITSLIGIPFFLAIIIRTTSGGQR